MEDFQSNLSELNNIPYGMECENEAPVQSARNIPVLQSGSYNDADKTHSYSALPLYQHGGFPYQISYPAVFPQVSSTKDNDSEQYPFAYRTMAVDMTNRNIPSNSNVIHSNGLVETTDLSRTKFTDDRLHVRKSSVFCRLRNKQSKEPSGESAQYIERQNQNNVSVKDDMEQVSDTLLSKDDRTVIGNCEECLERTDADSAHFLYICGGCQQNFYTICQLHSHIKTHNQNGSYYYSELTRTAYPKFDSCCTGSQTEDLSNNQKYSEQSRVFYEKFDFSSTGTQTVDHKSDKKKSKGRVTTDNTKEEEDLVSLKMKEDNLVMERTDFVNKTETDDDDVKKEVKVKLDDESERWLNLNSIVNPDSDTDEYNPEDSVPKSLQKRSKKNNKDYGRKKIRKGSKKLKHLKMTIRVKQGDKKDTRISFLTKDMKAKAVVNRRNKVDEKIICKLCDTVFQKKLYLRHHIKAKHSDVPHLCQLCSDSFPTNDELIEHRKTEHNRGFHQCELCDKVLSTKGMLEGHYLIHKGIKPFSCSVCVPKKEFTRKCQLKAHMDTHSTEKTLQCEFCGKPFNARYLMLSHVKHCGGIKPHKCEFCEMSFVSNHCLQRHRRTHTGEKPFICEVCAFASSNASCLARHMRIHTGEKPFICQYCKQTFAARGALKKHVRIHTQEKPYKCRFCTKAFTQNWNLKTHERQHTGETPYKCHVCGVGYKQNVLLKTHLRTHFAPNTDSSESQHVALNSLVPQCQNDNQSIIQNQSLVSLQTGSKPENLKMDFSENQSSQPQLVELHAQPLVPNILLTSFLHSGYNIS